MLECGQNQRKLRRLLHTPDSQFPSSLITSHSHNQHQRLLLTHATLSEDQLARFDNSRINLTVRFTSTDPSLLRQAQAYKIDRFTSQLPGSALTSDSHSKSQHPLLVLIATCEQDRVTRNRFSPCASMTYTKCHTATLQIASSCTSSFQTKKSKDASLCVALTLNVTQPNIQIAKSCTCF